MTAADPRIQLVRENAKFAMRHLSEARGAGVGLERSSVVWLESFIERQRERVSNEEARAGLVSVLGSFLGEVIVAAGAGSWGFDDKGALCVRLSSGENTYPFAAIDQQFEEGVDGGKSIMNVHDFNVGRLARSGRQSAVASSGGRRQ